MFSAATLERFIKMFDTCISAPEDIQPLWYNKDKERWEGGIAIKRLSTMKPVDGKGRNYGLATMLQRAPSVAAPTADTKATKMTEEGRELRRDLVQVRRERSSSNARC